METVRIVHRDGFELEVVVPVFEICKLATQLSIEVAKFRNYDLQYGYIYCRNVLLKNFYARVIGSRYHKSLPPFTFSDPNVEQPQSQLIDQINELPDDIKCEILSRVPGAQSLCKNVVRLVPPELKYAAIIPFACAQWAMTHRSSYTRTVLERAFEFIGPEILLLLQYADAEETALIKAEAQLRGDIGIESIKLEPVTSPEPAPVGLLTMSLDEYFAKRFRPLPKAVHSQQTMVMFRPLPDSHLRLSNGRYPYLDIMDQDGRKLHIEDIYDLYKIFTKIPDQWERIINGHDQQRISHRKRVRHLALEHPTIESLVQHATLVNILTSVPSVV